jgi:hypothetical protein
VEEDRASLEDSEFRKLIDRGVRQHVEERPEIRADLAGVLRAACAEMPPQVQPVARRVIAGLENIEAPLRNAAAIVRTYTAWLFHRLQETAEGPENEDEIRLWIERWRTGEVQAEEMAARLKAAGWKAGGPAADLLFGALEQTPPNRMQAAAAIDILGGIRSGLTSRVLAHAISEPMLDEDLELKAYGFVRAMWPLPRHYMLWLLQSHSHEDLPYRWFQLFVDADEVYSVDLILEEFAVHGADPAFQADLTALSDLLRQSKDPEAEEKILQALNAPETSRSAAVLLEDVLRTWSPPAPSGSSSWSRLSQLRAINQRYAAAAQLFDGGKRDEALERIEGILRDEPGYPFAVMLKGFMQA